VRVLVVGGTGSLGTVLTQKLASMGHTLSVLNKDSHKQAALRPLLPLSTQYYLSDICDHDIMREACHGQDVVINAAAIKRIEAGERYPQEILRVNVQGAANVANACREMHVSRNLLISSDKAAAASLAYGASKFYAERLWLASDSVHSAFAAIRYGNVVDSRGSAWHIWHEAIKQGKPLLVRKPEPTRFILDLNQAVGLVLAALHAMELAGGCVLIPADLPAFSLWDLACELESDPSKWQMESLLTGEKQHELLLAPTEFAEPVGDKGLWAICGWRSQMSEATRARFSSATAPRLTGQEVIAKMQKDNTDSVLTYK
jgi:UDP-N-acetylglucosamine 4,6-dehydratase/5-epimerase